MKAALVSTSLLNMAEGIFDVVLVKEHLLCANGSLKDA
jgi:hypothetical protein